MQMSSLVAFLAVERLSRHCWQCEIRRPSSPFITSYQSILSLLLKKQVIAKALKQKSAEEWFCDNC